MSNSYSINESDDSEWCRLESENKQLRAYKKCWELFRARHRKNLCDNGRCECACGLDDERAKAFAALEQFS